MQIKIQKTTTQPESVYAKDTEVGAFYSCGDASRIIALRIPDGFVEFKNDNSEMSFFRLSEARLTKCFTKINVDITLQVLE